MEFLSPMFNRPPPVLSEAEVQFWTDAQIARTIDTALPTDYMPDTAQKILRLSETLVVKRGQTFGMMQSEALAMELVRAQTDILVPRVVRVIDHWHGEGTGLLLMEYIPNAMTLHECWPLLPAPHKQLIFERIRHYASQLRGVQVTTPAFPGPLGPEPAVCEGLQFIEDRPSARGPFASTAELAQYYHNKLATRIFYHERGFSPPPTVEPLADSDFSPLVFTHNDLNMSNFLLDDEGRLWVIDWTWAGLYPPWFEYLGMLYVARTNRYPSDWMDSIPFMTEPDFRIEHWMREMGLAYTRSARNALQEPESHASTSAT